MTKPKRRRGRTDMSEQFIAHRGDRRESAAWHALPDEARRLLDRLELEHMRHPGTENGSLLCTYADFHKAGIRRSSIALAIRQSVALGFLEVKRHGYRTARTLRAPSAYTLTSVNGWGKSPSPTDGWRSVRDEADAAARLAAAQPAPVVDRPAK